MTEDADSNKCILSCGSGYGDNWEEDPENREERCAAEEKWAVRTDKCHLIGSESEDELGYCYVVPRSQWIGFKQSECIYCGTENVKCEDLNGDSDQCENIGCTTLFNQDCKYLSDVGKCVDESTPGVSGDGSEKLKLFLVQGGTTREIVSMTTIEVSPGTVTLKAYVENKQATGTCSITATLREPFVNDVRRSDADVCAPNDPTELLLQNLASGKEYNIGVSSVPKPGYHGSQSLGAVLKII